MFLNVMVVCRVPRLISSPRMTVSRSEDCVCFNHKHNEANGEENRDGTNNNYSNNHGKEGVTDSLDLVKRRRDSISALLTTLLLSRDADVPGR
ncbi:hypothetical protein ACNKHX_21020 [Shigella flexneri]